MNDSESRHIFTLDVVSVHICVVEDFIAVLRIQRIVDDHKLFVRHDFDEILLEAVEVISAALGVSLEDVNFKSIKVH